MKKIKYIILFLAVTLLGSCELDMQPESELTYNGFWDTEEAARAAHIGIVSKYRDYAYTLWRMGEIRSDVWGGNTIESPSEVDLINNNISATNVPFGNWANFYGLIHYINDFLKNAPNVAFKNEGDLNHLLGQVYGMRAHVYYTMLRAWGDVPINTEPLLEVNLETLKKPRSPKSEVMAQVKADIAKSLEYFGTDNSMWNEKNVYWSKPATLALKGDAYLWSGKVLGGGNADFTEAKTALNDVSGHALVPYNELWGQGNEFNNEFIFAFDYQQDQADNFYGSFTARAVDIAPLSDAAGQPLGDLVVNGASRFGPTDKTNILLDDMDDQRSNTFIKMYTDGAVHIPFVPGEASYSGAILKKFLGIIGDDGSRFNHNNVPLYRYADVLLMLAEAKNNLGEDPSAEINEVRERAYGDNFSGNEYVNASQEENTKAILEERYKEFIGEGKRWWDLVRAGDGIVFDELDALSGAEAYKIYYPISESMLANDDQLVQTEGY
ncbi:Starch-binding associating with outer membrane [Saccharicrinis carchari]|uniref:Starch-binding associating with outer membrane n=1 Tax=Saccharicrinis carchari TaxID=1168039 RepID=A0A521EQ22_SACCC|nr:RagB/SusD family nutrient uptake outer membrane protein [Saccharicrinis carchari]SMO85501.1 Starch-binding associating with outer membrane [Saccharicrinis carchari]